MNRQTGISLVELLLSVAVVLGLLSGAVVLANRVDETANEIAFTTGLQTLVNGIEKYQRRPDGFEIAPFLNGLSLPDDWTVYNSGTAFFDTGDEWIRSSYGRMQVRYYDGWPQGQRWRLAIVPQNFDRCMDLARIIALKGWHIRMYNERNSRYTTNRAAKLCKTNTNVVAYLTLFVD